MPTKSLTKLARWLRVTFPIKAKVRIRTVKPHPDLHGETSFFEDRVEIRISKGNFDQMQESLIEEWCHCLRNETPVSWKQGDDHDAIFWAILGVVTMRYREE